LTVGAGSSSNKSKVTVTSTVEFTPADAGSWKVSIRLFGDDTAGGAAPR
jgi:hypothetical protein